MKANLKIAQTNGYKYALKGTIYTELIVLFIVLSSITSAARSATGAFSMIVGLVGAIGCVNIVNFIVLTLFFAYFLGKKAGVSILKNRNNYLLKSYKTGFLIVIYSTLTASITALVINFFKGELPVDWFILFILRPIVWLFCLSFIPIFIAGSWYGVRLIDKTQSR